MALPFAIARLLRAENATMYKKKRPGANIKFREHKEKERCQQKTPSERNWKKSGRRNSGGSGNDNDNGGNSNSNSNGNNINNKTVDAANVKESKENAEKEMRRSSKHRTENDEFVGVVVACFFFLRSFIEEYEKNMESERR